MKKLDRQFFQSVLVVLLSLAIVLIILACYVKIDEYKKLSYKVDTKFGARDLTRKIMELISNEVCEEMVKAGKKAKKNIYVDLGKDDSIKVKFKD